MQIFHRDAEDLYREAFYDITPHAGTKYPCTQKDLNATGGANRRTTLDEYEFRNKTRWFAYPNKGPFLDARIAAREVYDHNDLKRAPSAAENEAINRLIAGFKKAGKEPWGPDLAIKAFCDLDKVFFCGRLKGHVCLAWKPDRSVKKDWFGVTLPLGGGKCVIQLNAHSIFLEPRDGSCFVQMFNTLLHEMCHAHEQVRALELGPTGWSAGRADGHGKNFGTMIHAVNRRVWKILGFKRDHVRYLRHHYAYDDDPPPAPKQPPPHRPPRQNTSRPAASHKSREELHDTAFRDVSLDSGTAYICTQSDLDATGGLARREYPKDVQGDRKAARKRWFPQPNHGPFVAPRQACLEIFKHNDLHRKPGKSEREAIERLCKAIAEGRQHSWGPDLIIKAFCDLDVVFFRGRLRGHVCVRWLCDWSADRSTTWGSTIYIGEGKCSIKLNADTILLEHPRPFERMFATMLHEMCHADAHTQSQEREMLKCASHGKNFGTMFSAVEKRAQKIFGLSLTNHYNETYPRHRYEKGEGYP